MGAVYDLQMIAAIGLWNRSQMASPMAMIWWRSSAHSLPIAIGRVRPGAHDRVRFPGHGAKVAAPATPMQPP